MDFDDYIEQKAQELVDFKKMFKRDWDATHDKVFQKQEERVKQLTSLADEWLEIMFPADKNTWRGHYDITILATKRKTEE